ncbi:MAG: endonuclease [Devosia sp.]
MMFGPIDLPWPDKILSPNARAHHFARSRAAKKARSAAWALALEAMHGANARWTCASLAWCFSPPSRRRFDADNIISSLKSAQDGIADALGIDDSNFRSTYSMGEPVKGGVVRLMVVVE